MSCIYAGNIRGRVKNKVALDEPEVEVRRRPVAVGIAFVEACGEVIAPSL